jgi:hypothetical protein
MQASSLIGAPVSLVVGLNMHDTANLDSNLFSALTKAKRLGIISNSSLTKHPAINHAVAAKTPMSLDLMAASRAEPR